MNNYPDDYETHELMVAKGAASTLSRFRPLESFLDRKELELNEIYLGSVIEHNDPMEEFIDFFFFGDSVIWENFFAFYLRCLLYYNYKASENKEIRNDIDVDFDLVEIYDGGYPAYKPLSDASQFRDYLSHRIIAQVVEYIANRKISRRQLIDHLTFILPIAISHLTHMGIKFESNCAAYEPSENDLDEHISKYTNEHRGTDESRTSESAIIQTHSEQLPDSKQQVGKHQFQTAGSGCSEFPDWFLDSLISTHSTRIYLASFTTNIEDPRMWSYYGAGHEGVCVKYRTQDMPNGDKTISTENFSKLVTAHKIKYIDEPYSCNFFENMMAIPGDFLICHWYSRGNGSMTTLPDIPKTVDEYNRRQKEFLCRIVPKYLTKTTHWRYENEYRIVRYASFFTEDNFLKKMTYDFSCLHSIVFGVRTPPEKRAKIIEKVVEKCKKEGRQEFRFYNALYSIERGQMIEQLEYHYKGPFLG